jgi:hypothetical protein
MLTPVAVLRASLEKHNDTFESLLKLIPPQYYIVNEDTEEQVRALATSCMPQPTYLSFRTFLLGCVEVPETQQEKQSAQAGC